MDQAFPCRRCATRRLTYATLSSGFSNSQITSARDYLSSPPHHWFAPNGPSFPPWSIPAALTSTGLRPKRSEARHLSRSARMAFCILTGTLSGFPGRPNSLRSPILRTPDQPFGRPDTHSTCLACLLASSTVFWDIVIPPYMKFTLHR